jgi:hypothetical protein
MFKGKVKSTDLRMKSGQCTFKLIVGFLEGTAGFSS